ncbi:MAG: flagellar basal-body rod protein FlgF [Alphaproteobacteria bacterium]|nr:flagellar basal-body rod protein FlgF [Alphaproteobacteria bacterium]
MENAVVIGLSGQTALFRKLSVTANNMANLNTPGFKRGELIFNEFLDRTRPGEKLSFVQDKGMAYDFGQGGINFTGNPFDLAIEGDGFFVIDTPQGPRYTRDGAFAPNVDGVLVNKNGHPVLNDNGGEINIPAEDGISINQDGSITTRDGANIATLRLVTFDNLQDLKRAGDSGFSTVNRPRQVEDSKIAQGFLEGSNVSGIAEVTSLIDIQRTYSRVSDLVKKEQERLRDGVNKLGRNTAA